MTWRSGGLTFLPQSRQKFVDDVDSKDFRWILFWFFVFHSTLCTMKGVSQGFDFTDCFLEIPTTEKEIYTIINIILGSYFRNLNKIS